MFLRLLTAAMLSVCAVSVAHADPVTYTFAGTFTGSLGVFSFTDLPGTITLVGNTSGTTSQGAGFYTNTTGVSTITLQGIGTALFLSPTFGAESQFDGAGFYDVATGFGVDLYDPALGYYALTAPFSDTGFLETSFAASFGTTEWTSLGDLSLTGDGGTSATFTASSVAPEPGSFALLGTGLAGVAGLVRRRLL